VGYGAAIIAVLPVFLLFFLVYYMTIGKHKQFDYIVGDNLP